jgi:tellurite resistance protein
MSTPSRTAVVFQPSRTTVQAMVMACALIACADGHVGLKERRTFLRFLRHCGALQRYGRAQSAAAFDTAAHEASSLTLDEICTAADDLRSVAGSHGAPLVAQAAAHVALADGVTWPQEIALLAVIRDRIGLGNPSGRAGG